MTTKSGVEIHKRRLAKGQYAFYLYWPTGVDESGRVVKGSEKIFTTEYDCSAKRLKEKWLPVAADRRYEKETAIRAGGGGVVAPARMPEAANLYLAWARSQRSESTADRAARLLPMFTTFLRSHANTDLVSEVSPGVMHEWRARRQDQGVGAATCNCEMSTLSAFFKWMVRRGWLLANPCTLEQLRADKGRVSLTVKTAKNFHDLMDGLADRRTFHNVVGVLGGTGIRIGELQALTFKCYVC